MCAEARSETISTLSYRALIFRIARGSEWEGRKPGKTGKTGLTCMSVRRGNVLQGLLPCFDSGGCVFCGVRAGILLVLSPVCSHYR